MLVSEMPHGGFKESGYGKDQSHVRDRGLHGRQARHDQALRGATEASAPVAAPTSRALAGLQAAVLGWYGAVGRELSFRGTRDPYAILVSEVMAQQTQIARAETYWRAWMARFPTFEALAAASPADVLRTWQGLGYDRRALNLLRCARTVVAEYGGRLPADIPELERLPGLGPYTARAVAALAFGQRVGAVDVNVRRVVGRIVGGPDGPRDIGAARLQVVADEIVPADEPGRWTHALMDLGATLCRIRSPRCEECPARPWCAAAAAWASRCARVGRGAKGSCRRTGTGRGVHLHSPLASGPDPGPPARGRR